MLRAPVIMVTLAEESAAIMTANPTSAAPHSPTESRMRSAATAEEPATPSRPRPRRYAAFASRYSTVMMPSPQAKVCTAPRRRSLSSAEMYDASLHPPKVSSTNTIANASPLPDVSVAITVWAAGSAISSPAITTLTRPSTSRVVRAYCTPPLCLSPATLSSVSATTTPAATTAERLGLVAPPLARSAT